MAISWGFSPGRAVSYSCGISRTVSANRTSNLDLPQDFLVNHVCGSFVEMTLWWIRGGMKQTATELDRYFRAVIEPVM